MRTTEQGQVYFYHSATGVSSWHDPRVPRDTEAERLGPLPPGWESRHTPSGRVYYVDHNNRTTQFTHPAALYHYTRQQQQQQGGRPNQQQQPPNQNHQQQR